MKLVWLSALLLVSGCKIQNVAQQSADHDFFHQTLVQLDALLQEFAAASPYCEALLAHSPTREDYVRNWQPSNEVHYCPESTMLESCQKKQDDAFRDGLRCYSN